MYVYKVKNKKLLPTIADINDLMDKAQINGDSRDPRALMFVLHKMSKVIPRLRGHILTRKTAIGSITHTISGPDDTITEELQTNLRPVIKSIIDNYLNAPLFGFYIAELDWSYMDANRFIPAVKRTLRPFEAEIWQEVIYLINTDDNNMTFSRERLDKYPPDQFLTCTDDSILYSLIYHVLLNHLNLQEWANFNTKLKGLIQAKADENEKADAGDALSNMLQHNYAVTNKETEFVFNEMTSSKGLDSFAGFKSELEDDIAIAILGQANTSDLPAGGGSRAALQILNLIKSDILFADLRMIKDIVNHQLIKHYFSKNYGQKGYSDYEFNFIFDEDKNLETAIRVIEGATRIGMAVKEEEAYNMLSLTPPDASDKILQVRQNVII